MQVHRAAPAHQGQWARPQYVDGKLGYTKIKLEDWQVFIVINLFAWKHAVTGLRRFLRGYEEVARKNAKSTLAAGILLFMATADAERARARLQRGHHRRPGARGVRRGAQHGPARAGFLARFGVTVGKHDITVPTTASSAKPLNAEGSTLDGLNVHFAVVDELHAHKTRAVYDVIDSATGARSQPLILMITTAGTDTSGICYEQRDYTVKVLEGARRRVVVRHHLHDRRRRHVARPGGLAQGEPNLGVSVKTDDMAAAVRKAQAMPSALNNVLTKRLNRWVNADSAWMPIEDWKRCGNEKLQLADFGGERCWIGMDLAREARLRGAGAGVQARRAVLPLHAPVPE